MKKSFLLATTSIVSLLTAYEAANPGWKKDANGNLELKDGNPIYVDASGREQTVEGNTIADRNTEARNHRIAKEEAEKKLKLYEGIDPEIARKAIDTVAKIDAKTLIDAGKVDEVKEAITKQFTTQLDAANNKNTELQNQINSMMISDVFKSSEFVRDGVAVPRDMFEATFKGNFKIEDGKIVAVDKAGNKLMSPTRFGEIASPDEALKLLVDNHPNKDSILKAPEASGSGNSGGGGSRGNGRVMKRAEFDKLNPKQAGEAAAAMGKGELTIVD